MSRVLQKVNLAGIISIAVLASYLHITAQTNFEQYIAYQEGAGPFMLAANEIATPIYIDEPMIQSTAIALLERIVEDQRVIIQDVTGKEPGETPLMWASYKDMQAYYDHCMRVPDDVVLLLCGDNWGNIRKLPKPAKKPRAGDYGIYYHFGYDGESRNYKWLIANLISRIWEQMYFAYTYDAKQLWIVNIGNIKLIWNADDGDNWIIPWINGGRAFGAVRLINDPTMFDRDYNEKPAYKAVADKLQSNS